MAKTIPVRLPEGMFEAVSVIAETLSFDKSTTVAILVMVGLDDVDPTFWSERIMALIQADAMESSASFLRTWADLSPDERKLLETQLGALVKRMTRIFRVLKGAGIAGGDEQ